MTQDKVIDFTSDKYRELRSTSENYKDGLHLKNQPAKDVVAVINHQIDDWIQNGELPNIH